MHLLELIYIFFCVYLIFLLLSKRGIDSLRGADYVFMAISFFFLMYFHVMVDINSVEDLPAYKEMFTRSYTESLQDNFSRMWSQEYLFVIYNYLVSFLTHDYVVYLIIYNTIIIGVHYWLAMKYSPSIPISIVLFILFSYNQSLFIVRQYLAMSIILLTVPLILNRKLIPFIVLCAIAFFIHNSTIMWFPIYFFYGIRNRKAFIASMIAMAGFFILLNTDIGGYILMLGFSYDSYLMDGVAVGSSSLNAKLIPTFYLLCYVFSLKGHVLDEGINKLCFMMLTLLTIGYVFAPPISLLGRILQLYQTMLIIAVPIMLTYIKSFEVRIMLLISILALHGYSAMKVLSEDYFASYRLDSFNILVTFGLLIITIAIISFMRKHQYKNKEIEI